MRHSAVEQNPEKRPTTYILRAPNSVRSICPAVQILLVFSLLLFGVPATVLWNEAGKPPLEFAFTNIAPLAGLTAVTVYGGKEANKYLLETTGCGVAFFDYDNDGWLDIFQVNGSTLGGFPKGLEPISHLYRNRRDGSFEDVTLKSGLRQSGWGQGVCTGDLDNDGHEDLFVSSWGQDQLFRNLGNGRFENVTRRAGLMNNRQRWGSGCAFLDYDRDGYLDLFVANYIDFDIKSAPVPESGLCLYKGIRVACGPPGLPGGKNVLYHNKGNGTFVDVSDQSRITQAGGTYGLGVSTLDFNDDGWTDIYVANDSNPSTLYRNNRDGKFTDVAINTGSAYSQDGKPQAGMGVAVGDYDRNGSMDIFKTNFAGDTSTLYANSGKDFFEDMTFSGGIGLNTRWLGWGCGFVDFDNNSWLDLFLANGHVYPEVYQLNTEAGYKQRKVIYRNLQNGKFEDVTESLGPPATTPKASRGCAFGDFDNDGDIDVLINNVHEAPDLFRLELQNQNHWLTVRLVGTRSNRSAIGARVRCISGEISQWQEVRGGGSYFSQSDLRVHFGLGLDKKVDRLEVRWPNGLEESWTDLATDTFVTLKEGSGNSVSREGKSDMKMRHDRN
jgi:enediyne biosynthesis protein E4